MKKQKIIVILGPTASGKSKLSIELAKRYNAEIINADAEQVYKDTNIGTAKITKDEMENIKHHLIDFLPLTENYSVKEYQTDARKIIEQLQSEDKNIIIVGGTGLYIKALLYDYKFTDSTSSLDYSEYSNEELKNKVDSIYKENNIHVNNRKRLERFLSHYESTGEIIKNNEYKDIPLYDFTMIGLSTDRETLYNKINSRVDSMIDNGLVDETIKLKDYHKLNSIIGYKEILMYLNNQMSLEESIDLIKRNTRKYAKRQYTWFNNQFDDINWFNVDYDNFDNTINDVIEFLESK